MAIKERMSGNEAVSYAIRQINPDVMPAFPITPSTEIPQMVSTYIANGEMDTEFIPVESEHSSMSATIGAEAAGARSLTATSSAGLALMWEELLLAASNRLPLVMALVNRTLSGPININCDHSDGMGARDTGWIQIYAENNQEACDMHIEAFRIAEELSLPVMVCMDGFVLTHAFERIDIPSQEDVDRFLPPYQPRQELDPDNPVSIGAMVGPEAFTEVRYLAHVKHLQALDLIPQVQQEFKNVFGRDSGGLVSSYRMEDAELAVVAMGSCVGTIKDTVDELRDAGVKIGVVAVKCFRPFPVAAVREALKGAKRVVVVERTLAVGSGGVLSRDVMVALEGFQSIHQSR